MRVLMSGTWRSVDEVAAILNHPGHSPQKVHGGGGGSDDDFDEDDGPDLGEFGYGVDPKGVSYTEYDLDEDGNPRFSQEYRDKYGPVTDQYVITVNDQHTVTVTKKGSLQFTDDAAGTQNRVVVQEFTKSGARGLSNDMNDVIDNGGAATNSKTGVNIQANGQVHPQGGYHGMNVTWANGTANSFSPVESADLAESLGFAADDL